MCIRDSIRIAQPPVIELILSEFQELVAYEPHSEMDLFGNKKSPLNLASRFLTTAGYVSGSVTVTERTGTVTSYDNGPGSTTTTVT